MAQPAANDTLKRNLLTLPLGWHWNKLGDYVASYKNGYGRRPKSLEEGPIVLRLADVSQGFIDLTNTRRVMMSDNELQTYRLTKGDILFSRVNGSREQVGRCILVDKDLDDLAFNDHLIRVKLKNGLLAEYLQAITTLPLIRAKLLAFIPLAQGGQLTINQKALDALRIPVPPLPEQRAIAAILGTWDRALELCERRLVAAEQRKKALMQQLLTGRVRFPEFAGEEWRKVKVSEMGKVITGKTPSKNHIEFYGGSFPWASPVDMNGYPIISTVTTLTDAGKKVARVVPKGSVLVTCIGSIGKNAIAGVELAFNQQINAIVVNKVFDNEFVYYLIDYQPHKLQKYAGRTSVSIVNKSTFKEVQYFVPLSIVEQRRIAAVLSACDREIALLAQKRDALQRQKKGLMQRLLTGRVRVAQS